MRASSPPDMVPSHSGMVALKLQLKQNANVETIINYRHTNALNCLWNKQFCVVCSGILSATKMCVVAVMATIKQNRQAKEGQRKHGDLKQHLVWKIGRPHLQSLRLVRILSHIKSPGKRLCSKPNAVQIHRSSFVPLIHSLLLALSSPSKQYFKNAGHIASISMADNERFDWP